MWFVWGEGRREIGSFLTERYCFLSGALKKAQSSRLGLPGDYSLGTGVITKVRVISW